MVKKDYPLIEVGEFELNRNPENFFADVEQSAFAPSNLVPGIGASLTECYKLVYLTMRMHNATV